LPSCPHKHQAAEADCSPNVEGQRPRCPSAQRAQGRRTHGSPKMEGQRPRCPHARTNIRPPRPATLPNRYIWTTSRAVCAAQARRSARLRPKLPPAFALPCNSRSTSLDSLSVQSPVSCVSSKPQSAGKSYTPTHATVQRQHIPPQNRQFTINDLRFTTCNLCNKNHKTVNQHTISSANDSPC